MQQIAAKSFADQGLGAERYSRIDENKALANERNAAAIRDEETALLDLVRALKEIDGLDMAHMQQAVQLMGIIKQQEQQAESTIKLCNRHKCRNHKSNPKTMVSSRV